MAQQQTQFEALVAALQQTIAAQGQTGSQLAEAARAIADASTRMATGTTGTSGTSFDTGSRVLKGPDVFAPGTLDEEVSSWQDWTFIFKNYVGFMDPNYLSEFSWAESHDGPIKESEYVSGSDTGRRAVKLYSVLSSYLKNRPLKILRSVLNNDGFEVWRRLTVELQPTSRSRSLAMAQALVSFPSMSKGASLYDYVLTYEKLVDEYEKLSGLRYDPNLKIGTLLKGIPNDLKRTLLFDMDDKTTYEQMRSRLLEYERSSQTWSAENILSSLSVQSDHTKHKEYHGPIPMEIDRIEGKGKGKGKGKDGKGKGKGGKGKGKSSGKGYGSYGRGRGKGRGRGRGKGRGKGGKGKGKYARQVGEKGYGGKGKSSGKGKGPACYICGKTGHFAAECYQNPGKGKGKGKSIRNVHGEYEQWNQDNEQWNEKWQNWNNNEGDKQSQQSTHASSSSSQPSVRMVSQARGNESVRRVMQESTVTIEEVEEDEVVDLIGMFNSCAKGSSVRMVKEGKKKQHQVKPNPEEADEDSEEGMPRKRQRESILFHATRRARDQLQHRGYEHQEVRRRANVLRATWNQVKDINDLVNEVLEFLKDYPDKPIRQQFLEDLEDVYGEEDQEWREMRKEQRAKRKEMRERKEEEKSEEKRARGSKDKVRRLEVYDISEGDDEMTVIDDLMEWYLGEDVDRVRMVNDRQYERDWYEPVEVCLDSGADCHVLPLSFYSEELGTTELPELRMMITDAQGNAIRTTETRANITFEFQKENGKTLKVIDSCVFGEVTQPLFAVGKLWKTGWGMEPYSHEKAFLVKGNSKIPITFQRNSTMTEVRIYRAEAKGVQEEPVKKTLKRVKMRVGLKECLDREKWTDGWFFLPDGRPARFDWSMKTTYDPTEDDMAFPCRTVFYGPCSGDDILWDEIEMFTCAEEWQGFEVMEFEKIEDVVITIMERKPQDMSRYIHEPEKKVPEKPQEEKASGSGSQKDKMEVDAQEKLEKRLPAIGEDEFEEKMIVGGVELTPESSLKELKQACKQLGIGVTGSKQLLWQRLKKEVTENKYKTMVDISKSIQKEFERDPSGPKPVYEPTPEERALHELTHLPKADWCESCTATRSREDNFETSRKKYDGSLVSMDFKFTGTRDEENAKDVKDALCISLVMVDQESKFVHAIPVPSKEVTSYLVEEVCRVLMLMEKKVILRTDTEPAMLALRNKVQLIRKMNKLETEIQDVSPDEHQGLQVERWVQTVRNLSKTLVYAAEKQANVKITSESTLYPWLARHACFLLNRFVVQGGKTPFEVLFDREYRGALAPWGSTVLAKPLPKVKEKGEPWKKGIFVGKDHVSNANLVSTSSGIIKARTMRRCTPVFDIETMIEACGTPWNHTQKQVVTRKPRRRLPPHRGIEALPPAPRSPSQQAASDATPTEGYQPSLDDDGEDGGDDEDPGEGTKRKATSSASGGTASSEELVADEDGVPSPTKRGAEARGSTEPSPTRMRVEEPPAVVEERPEKVPKVSKVVKLPEPGFTDSEAEEWRANAKIRTLSDDDPMSASSASSEFRARIRRVCSLKSVRDVERFLKKEELKYNDDEEVDIEEFNGLEAEVEDEEEIVEDYEDEEMTSEDVPTWSHDLEEGPPKLEEHELEAVDRQSRKTEIERLMEMKVLKPITEDQATSGNYKHLSTKIVYDWRHRDGQWKRRGRLVAREFRWLTDYDLAALFSPTGVASTVKLLSALFVSTDSYSLGSIDIGDAYLQVEQDEPTIVEVDGKWYELGYTLPGQRTGSSAWFNKLQGIVEKYGLKSDDGLPALFYRLPKDGEPGIIILSHVDDLEVFATKRGFEDLVKKLKAEGLKVKVEGPLERNHGSIGFLKRTFTATLEGVEISMNAKYVESLEEVLELEKAFAKKLPIPADGGRAIHNKKGADTPLTPEDHHLYRKGVGILLYLAPERPDLMFALKKLSMKLASPTEGDLELLRFVGKYLKGCPDIHLLHRTSYPGCSFQEKRNRSHEPVRNRDIYSQKSLVEICSDSDWAADRETRQSVSCGAIFVNGNMVHFQSKRQRSVSLSSCESETIAAVSIMSEGIFLQKLIERITGIAPEVRLYIDSSSSRQLISRKGLGKARHLDVSLLWIQKMKNVLVKAIKGVDNPADLGTKALSRDKIKKYLRALGYKGEFLEDEEQQVRRTKNGMKTVSVSMIAKIVAILMSEGICVEGAFAMKEQSSCLGLNFMSCCLICMVVCCMLSACIPAAVWDQAFRFGKKGKEEKEKFGEKKRKEEMANEENMPQEMESLRPPAEPTPTEEGESVMEQRAKELKQKAIDAKLARQMALEKALQEKALEEERAAEEKALEEERAAEEKENPTGSGALQPEAAVESGPTVEKKDKEEEKDESENDSESSEEEQTSSDDDEEENPTGSGKQQSVNLSDVPAVEEADTTRSDVPAVEEANQQTQDEESKEEKKEKLGRDMDTYFKGVLRTLATRVEGNKQYSATRTVLALYNSLMVSFATPSVLQEEDLRDALLLAELNRETLNTLDRQRDRTDKFRTLLRAKAQALEAERQRKNEEIGKKLGWIQQKMTEVRAEENALEKMTQFHESVETYVTTGLRELRNLQKSEDAVEMQWSGLNYDMTKEGGEKMIDLTFYERLFSERMSPSTSPLVELESSLKDFENVTIDLEKETPAQAEAGKMGPPEPPAVKEPRTKKMPQPLHKEEKEKKRDEKLLQEKKKREVEEAAASAATASEEDSAKRPRKEISGQEMMKELINAERVPTDYLDVEVSQSVWDLLSWNSRERALCEQRAAAGQKCFFLRWTAQSVYVRRYVAVSMCFWKDSQAAPVWGYRQAI